MRERREITERVLVASPHPSSRAALMLLQLELSERCSHRRASDFRVWLSFRKRYMRDALRRSRVLSCHYCRTSPLKVNNHNTKPRQRATIDHLVPLARGGGRYDPRNLVVACDRCNNKKADSLRPREVVGESPAAGRADGRRGAASPGVTAMSFRVEWPMDLGTQWHPSPLSFLSVSHYLASAI